MRQIPIFTLLLIAALLFSACENEPLTPVAEEPERLSFNTTFLENYQLNAAAQESLAERFTWRDANFGTPTETTYNLEAATTADFTDYIGEATDENFSIYNIGTTTSNELPVTVAQLVTLANLAGLDNDPETDTPNAGQLFFRIRAYIGEGSLETFSETQMLNVELQELTEDTASSAIEISSWGVVGSAYNDWGAFPDARFYTTETPNVLVSYVNLLDGAIKFRENNEWTNSFGDLEGDGILDTEDGNDINVSAGDYKITFNTATNAYTIEPFSWGIVGSGFNDWGNAGPDAILYYDYTTDTFKASVQLLDGEIKFRMNNAWDVSFGDAGNDGVLDTDADNNIPSTEGHYLVTVDFKDNSYSIVESTVWGIVGSGFNDWGNAGPDAALTEIQPGIWFAENITLLDGEIKFRMNNVWGGDFGDANNDGILDQDPDNNITSEAGNYVVSIDFTNPTQPLYVIGKR